MQRLKESGVVLSSVFISPVTIIRFNYDYFCDSFYFILFFFFIYLFFFFRVDSEVTEAVLSSSFIDLKQTFISSFSPSDVSRLLERCPSFTSPSSEVNPLFIYLFIELFFIFYYFFYFIIILLFFIFLFFYYYYFFLNLISPFPLSLTDY